MKNSSVLLIILILLLTIGFASVTTNIIVNSNANIGLKTDDFSVEFTSAQETSSSTISISEDKKVINYSTNKLTTTGNKVEINYEIFNNSSQYDSNIILTIDVDESIRNKLSITYETFDATNLTLLSAKERKQGKVIITLLNNITSNIDITISLNAIAVSRDTIEYGSYTIKYNPNGGTGSMNDQVVKYGDRINLLSNNYTRAGYQFLGWTTNVNTNENYYPNEAEVTNITQSGTTINLYAIWLKNDYSYTGKTENIKIPVSGLYKLETWGAQGGSYNGTGGYGAYSKGEISLNVNQDLYISVGGAGSNIAGGFNGGGSRSNNGYGWTCGSGGGATHIAFNPGLLSTLSNNINSIIIVSGGGGGSGGGNNQRYNGGHGGGITGTNGSVSRSIGGTQTGPGRNYNNSVSASFGQGASPSNEGAGGGGFYGGGAGADASIAYNGGGGSGYIGNPLLINKQMVCYSCATSNDINTKTISNTCTSSSPTVNCSKQGHGYARITFIG